MSSDILYLRISDSRVSAEFMRGPRSLWSGEADYAGPADLAEVIGRIAVEPELIRAGTRVRVELEKPLAQSRVLDDLPRVAESQLRPMVEQQAHRYFRKNGKPLVIDACYHVGPDRHRVVQLAATEEPVVTAVLDGVRAAGLVLERISPAGPSGHLSLLPPVERERRRRASRLSLRRLGISVTVLWILAVAATLIASVKHSRSVERELALLADPVTALAALRREIATGAAMITAIETDAAGRFRAIRFLSAVTDAFPDSAFLTSLTVDSAGRGFLGGYARRASEVLARLERSSVVIAPRLDAQPGREVIAGVEWERFNISFGGDPE